MRTDGRTKDIEILKKMVSMSQINLTDLRHGDLLNLKEDLCDLVGYGSTGEHREKFFRQLTTDHIARIQGLFRMWVKALIEGKKSFSWTVSAPSKHVFEANAQSPSERFEYNVIFPDPVDAAAISFNFLVCRSDVAPNRFRECPECGLLFFLSRKPDERTFYCSTRCASRAATRNYREGKGKYVKTRPHLKRSHSRSRTTSQSAESSLMQKSKRDYGDLE